MAATIIKTITVFKRVGGPFFHSLHMADQYGTLMAGAWCLTRDEVQSNAEAIEMLASYEWDEHINVDDKDDPHQTLPVIMSSFISCQFGTYTIFQRTMMVLGRSDNGVMDRAKAQAALRTHGVTVNTNRNLIVFAHGRRASLRQ